MLYFSKSYNGPKQRVEKKDVCDPSNKKFKRLSYFSLKTSIMDLKFKTHAGQKIILSELLQITNVTGKFS